MDELRELGETMTASEKLFDGRILHLYRDTVRLPNGHSAERETIRHIGAVAIAALTDRGELIVERQYRYPVGQVITEIPAGKLDRPDEDRLGAARRELSEETGFEAGEWTCLGDYYPAAAYCDERVTLYLARDLRRGCQHPDEDEFIRVSAVPLAALVQDVMEGRIPDGKTQVAVLKVWKHLQDTAPSAR